MCSSDLVGGFVNIAQSARRVVFCCPFRSDGLDVAMEDGRLRIRREGRLTKFVRRVRQVCFHGPSAVARGQQVLYVTERAVFTLGADGLRLMEVAPGIDAARDLGIRALWVNAGGDLRAQGVALPVSLRDERAGGVTPFGTLCDAALATSDFREGARAHLWRHDSGDGLRRHVSVMAPTCATADALTKVIAAWGMGDPRAQVLLQAHRAQAWVHDAGCTPAV